MGTASEDLLAASNQFMNTMFNLVNSKQTKQSIDNQDKQFYENLAWQTLENNSNREFLKQQNAAQLDFANRELADNTRIADNNFLLQKDAQAWNKQFQTDAFNYQKELNATQMEREDNAIQRQVADYTAAGFSPLAAIGGNGSAAGSLSTFNPSNVDAAQYDMSGINAAAGQYADFARQYAQLAFTAQQDYINKRTDAAMRHNNEITGARLALQQLKSDNFYKGQSSSLAFYNTLINNKNKKLENEYLEEQLSDLKDEHKFNLENGYRSKSPVQALTDAVLEYINKHRNDGQSTLEAAFDLSRESAEKVYETIETGKKKISQDVAQKIDDADLSPKLKTAVMFYLTSAGLHFANSLAGRKLKAVVALGKEIYENILNKD